MSGLGYAYIAVVGMRLWARVVVGLVVFLVCLPVVLLCRCCRSASGSRVLAHAPVSPGFCPAPYPVPAIETLPTVGLLPAQPQPLLQPQPQPLMQPQPQPAVPATDANPPSYSQVMDVCDQKQPPAWRN